MFKLAKLINNIRKSHLLVKQLCTVKGGYMTQPIFSSPVIANQMKRIFGNSIRVVKIEMRHEDVVKKYVMRIEEGRNKPATSKLPFH